MRKMNIDTDTYRATREGVLNYYKENEGICKSAGQTRKAKISRTRNTMTRAYGCVLARLDDRSSEKVFKELERD